MSGSRLIGLMLLGVVLGNSAVVGAEDRWFARDKAAHVGATAGIAAGSYGLASIVTERERWRIVVGSSVGLGAGVAKELWDRSHGDPSWRDLTWSTVGAAAGVTLAWVVNRSRHHRRAKTASFPTSRPAFDAR